MPVYGAAFKQVRTVTGKFPQKTPQRDVCGASVSEDTHKDTEFTAVRVPDNVRAMHLSILVQENPLANTTGHQGYVAPDKAVMQQVKSSLEQKIKQMQISLTGEPVLRLTGLSAATLPHMDYEVAGTPAQRKVWQDKIDQQGAELKARGLLS